MMVPLKDPDNMRKSILLLATLLVVLCSQLTVAARANDGDWTEDNVSHWWWKIVSVGDMLHAANPAVRIEEIRSTKPGYRAYAVSFLLTNQSREVYKGGESYRIEQQVTDPSPQPWKPVLVSAGRTPVMKPGESIRLSAVVYTPDKQGLTNFVALTIE
jgi:hypothetical protein